MAVTSEPQYLADEAEEDWQLNYKVIGDPHHELRQALSERDWLDIYRNEDWQHFGTDRQWARHPNGYYQPAVLAVTRDGRILYRWRCVPKHSNISGAGARPEASYVWQQIQSALHSTDDAALDEDPEMTSKDPAWPVFMTFLLAHGWFLKPRAFPLSRDKDQKWGGPQRMIPRILGFAGLWVAALATLPLTWVGVAAAIWVVIVTPGVMEFNRKFQHVD